MSPTTSEPARATQRNRLRLVISLGGPLAIVGLIVYVLASHGGDFSHAADRASLGALIAATGLSVVTLLARTEAVVLCLEAMGSRPRRREIHAANSLTFIAMSVNHYVATPVRTGLLKRIDRERAPTLAQMILVDASTTLIEALLVAAVIVVAAGTLKLPWWVPPLIAIAAIGGLAAALLLRRRFRAHPAFAGLDVLAHSRHRLMVAGLMAIVITCQIVRTLIVLRAVGLHPSLLQAAATFVAAGTLSSLFAGPAAGAAGAPLIVFGHRSIGAAGAAGLILSITGLVAALIYGLAGAPLLLSRLRRAPA